MRLDPGTRTLEPVKRIAILGSTGSIGTSALDVARTHRRSRRGRRRSRRRPTSRAMVKQILEFRPRAVAMATGDAMDKLRAALGGSPAEISGVGNEGLVRDRHASRRRHRAVRVVGHGGARRGAVRDRGRQDHRARQQGSAGDGRRPRDGCARARRASPCCRSTASTTRSISACTAARAGEVRRLILTASGGPFRGRSLAALAEVTAADALKHPTWQMGPKITIDSATLMNKGLEVIEAHWLFGVPPSQIEVVVHPQSIVHSMVELKDGSIIAQMGITDMRLPIQYAFAYPDRWDAPVPFLDLTRQQAARVPRAGLGRLPVPAAGLSRARGGTQPADRVERGQRGRRIVFSGGPARLSRTFPQVIAQAMDAHTPEPAATLAGRPARRRLGPDARGRAGARVRIREDK